MIRIAIPYLFAASGGVVAERAGIVSLTLEGFMLSGAFAAVLGTNYSGSPWVGVLCGVFGRIDFRAHSRRRHDPLSRRSGRRWRRDQSARDRRHAIFPQAVLRQLVQFAARRRLRRKHQHGGLRQSAALARDHRRACHGIRDLQDAVRLARPRGGRASRRGRERRSEREARAIRRGGVIGNAGGAGWRLSRARSASVHRPDDGGPRIHRDLGGDLRTMGSHPRRAGVSVVRGRRDAPDTIAGEVTRFPRSSSR